MRPSTSGWSPNFTPPRIPCTRYGAFDIDSIPPATSNRASPALMACAASITACKPEPHTLLMVYAGTAAGTPACIIAWRAGTLPDARLQDVAHDHLVDCETDRSSRARPPRANAYRRAEALARRAGRGRQGNVRSACGPPRRSPRPGASFGRLLLARRPERARTNLSRHPRDERVERDDFLFLPASALTNGERIRLRLAPSG